MAAENVERKLTTVLCADVAGYSRLMDGDEEATLATLSDYREAFKGLIDRHRGNLVNTAGDSVLADFPSVVEAVQCAVEVQQELGGRNADLPDGRRMDFRIGINVGDVMVKGGDLFGEGINVAARLQEIAQPGGICVSGTVYDQVRNKLTLGFEFLGQRAVKNIAEEVPVYRLQTGVEVAVEAESQRARHSRARHSRGKPSRAGGHGGTSGKSVEERAQRQVVRLRRFYRTLTWYGCLIGFLFFINMLTSPFSWWWYWPALGLGIPVTFHALSTFSLVDRLLGHDWEERKFEEVKSKLEREG
ncbi:MAG: adenylate/guanylate cyclase domain-containing protein [Alphaproteobacteria bacterium]|nr:adenylate/guanylate cyclase domain-containing protein [Alphaproteobacteria bacterium]